MAQCARAGAAIVPAMRKLRGDWTADMESLRKDQNAFDNQIQKSFLCLYGPLLMCRYLKYVVINRGTVSLLTAKTEHSKLQKTMVYLTAVLLKILTKLVVEIFFQITKNQ